MTHPYRLVARYTTGTTEHDCPLCPRRVLFNINQRPVITVLVEGDADQVHTGADAGDTGTLGLTGMSLDTWRDVDPD